MVGFLVVIAVACLFVFVLAFIARFLFPPQPRYEEPADLRRADDAEGEESPRPDDVWTAAKGHVRPWSAYPQWQSIRLIVGVAGAFLAVVALLALIASR
jgi:hypothetical protein